MGCNVLDEKTGGTVSVKITELFIFLLEIKTVCHHFHMDGTHFFY